MNKYLVLLFCVLASIFAEQPDPETNAVDLLDVKNVTHGVFGRDELLEPLFTQPVATHVTVTEIQEFTVTKAVPVTEIVVENFTQPILVTEIVTVTEKVPVTTVVTVTELTSTTEKNRDLTTTEPSTTTKQDTSTEFEYTTSTSTIATIQTVPFTVVAAAIVPIVTETRIVAVTEVPIANVTKIAECRHQSACFGENACGTGKCLGTFPGTCNCLDCINNVKCEADSQCGGLKGACDFTSGRCDCVKGYAANGFSSLTEATRQFCNVKACTGDGHAECFGLSCNMGRCFCQ